MNLLIYIALSFPVFANNQFLQFIREFEQETDITYAGTIFMSSIVPKTHEAGVAVLDARTPYASNIYINPKQWTGYTHSERRWLIYHELSHAVFGSMHNNEILPDGCGANFMYFQTLDSKCIRKHEQRYLQQLKSVNLLKGSKLDVYKQILK